MHLLEDLALLAADLEAHLEPDFAKLGGDVLEALAALRKIDDHHHVEVALDHGLRDVQDVDLRRGKVRAGLRQDTHGIFSNDCYYGFLHSYLNTEAQRHREFQANRPCVSVPLCLFT